MAVAHRRVPVTHAAATAAAAPRRAAAAAAAGVRRVHLGLHRRHRRGELCHWRPSDAKNSAIFSSCAASSATLSLGISIRDLLLVFAMAGDLPRDSRGELGGASWGVAGASAVDSALPFDLVW